MSSFVHVEVEVVNVEKVDSRDELEETVSSLSSERILEASAHLPFHHLVAFDLTDSVQAPYCALYRSPRNRN